MGNESIQTEEMSQMSENNMLWYKFFDFWEGLKLVTRYP